MKQFKQWVSDMKKCALITGSSSGIGVALVKAYADQGYNVVAVGRNAERLEQAVQGYDTAVAKVGDISNSQACDEIIAFAIDHFKRIDVLVNNAGVIYRNDTESTTDELWFNTLNTNLSGAFFMSRAAMPHLKDSRGAIVNIASDWGLVGGENAVAYCASKGGMVLMTKAMALDHAKDGVRVNAICPGDVDTPMLETEAAQRGVNYREAMEQNNADSPTGRITQPSEVAALAFYLSSDVAAQITGTAIPIDGGNTA